MVKAIKFIKNIIIFATLSMLCLLIYSFFTVPDEIYTVPNRNINLKEIYSLRPITQEITERELKTFSKEGNYKVNVKLLGTIPVKTLSMTVGKRRYVVPSGNIFGLRLFTNGVVIVSTGTVDTQSGTVNPAKIAGLEAGDAITQINGQDVTTCKEVTDIFAAYNGYPFEIKYVRNNKEYSCSFNLYYSVNDKKYLAGLWIRDSAAGIGTMTFYEKDSGIFAGLGHGVYDTQSSEILPLYNGDIVGATINGCYKGKNGQAGELCGVFTSNTCGLLNINCETGVYGYLNDYSNAKNEIAVALKDEVQTGAAQIISTVDEKGPQYYSIEIEKIDKTDSQFRNMVIKITDERLIQKTGGIVQGMSGSPIIQNGMLVGAVTHVYINDPLHGYAIFAYSMLETSDLLIDESFKKAS